jgi:predicted transcriptional regulator
MTMTHIGRPKLPVSKRRVSLTVRVSPATKEALFRLSQVTGRTVSTIVEQALEKDNVI